MKILYITQAFPCPPDSGGKIKTYQTLRLLGKKHQIYLLCFAANPPGVSLKKKLERICYQTEVVVSPYPTAQFKDIKQFIFKSLFSPLPFIVFRHQDKKMKRLVKKLIDEEKFDVIHIDHLNMAPYLPKKKECLWVLEEHNIESEINWEIVKKEKFNKFKLFSLLEVIKLAIYERRMVFKFDWIFAISEDDGKKLIKLGAKEDRVVFLPTPFSAKPLFCFKKQFPVILFVGMLSWWPNKDGFFWFYKNILPLIKREIPDVKFILVGKEATKEMINLYQDDPNFELVGYVKDKDLEKYLSQASVFIVPLRSGSGIRIKILTALSAGLPVVSTRKGAEGVVNRSERGIILADTPDEFANAVVKVLKEKKFADELSKSGIEFIKKNYSNKKAQLVLERVYNNQQSVSRIFLTDLPVDYLSLKTIVPKLLQLAKDKRKQPYFVTYLNAHNFNLAFKNSFYRKILKKADLVYADGWGVVWAARLFGCQLPGRLTTKDFFDEFCRMAEKGKMSLFFLGGEEKVVIKMVKILMSKFPQIRIKGWQNGFFDDKEETIILSRINKLRPDFLVVGMGSPKQEKWLYNNKDKLNIRVGWCVGGLFDFISGEKPSCPKWLGNFGFEWLFRLITDTKRLWRRYLIGGPEFLYRVIKLKLNL